MHSEAPQARSLLLCLLLVLISTGTVTAQPAPQVLVDRYIEAWADFYPSAAFAYGDVTAAAAFEAYREQAQAEWLAFNEATARDAEALLAADGLNASARMDLQVLLGQTEDELANWREDQPLSAQPQWYAEQISQALTHLIVKDQLSGQARSVALLARLAGVPKPTTLIIALSPPHFSGAAIGGVYPTGPFAPETDTIFYVPSIPDSAEPTVKEDFYRSFNMHFNTMIMAHEMFPGHYLQYKVAVSQAPAIRSLFANGSYVEGWGCFSEEIMLDAGWADDAPLTRLAHLRKRLENATRAYVSVQVNTAGWDESQVFAFARDEGLLAPQFAKNLWQRVVNSPLQITDYFTGYQHFKRLFASYRARPQNNGTQHWVDAVLRAGPVPPVMLSSLL